MVKNEKFSNKAISRKNFHFDVVSQGSGKSAIVDYLDDLNASKTTIGQKKLQQPHSL